MMVWKGFVRMQPWLNGGKGPIVPVHVMKAIGGAELYSHSLLTLALGGSLIAVLFHNFSGMAEQNHGKFQPVSGPVCGIGIPRIQV
jgi:hypothetical protein